MFCRYPDYVMTASGLQYKDMRLGSGETPKVGQIAVIDWQGYTVGYYGRVFEARNKVSSVGPLVIQTKKAHN